MPSTFRSHMRPRTLSAASSRETGRDSSRQHSRETSRDSNMDSNGRTRPARADRRPVEGSSPEPRGISIGSYPSSSRQSQHGMAPRPVENSGTANGNTQAAFSRQTPNGRPRAASPRHATDEDETLPQLTPGVTEDMLEVDEDEDEDEYDDDDEEDDNRSTYAASHYPDVLARYRTERFDAMTINSSSRSLYVDDLDYNFENGRRYCGEYFFPNDDLEQDRLRVVHQVFLNVFNLKLTVVPLDDPHYILDIGTGTGEWAISIGEQYPACEVVGVDISAIQPTAVPHNVFFEVDDCEIEWMRPNDSVDLVHLRDMAGAFSDWEFIYQQAFSCLRPGGYIEVLDFHDHTSGAASFFNCFPPDARIHVVAQALLEASTRAGRPRGTFHMEPELFYRAGYVNVNVSEHSIPLDPLNNSVGKLWLISCLHMVEASALRLLTKYLNWEPARVLELCDQVCDEIKERALRPNPENTIKVYLRVVTAQKPGPGVCEHKNSLQVPYRTERSFREDESCDDSTIQG